MIRTVYRHRSGTILADLAQDQLANAIRDNQARLWIDLQSPTEEESSLVLRQLYHFHPLAVEDAINDSHVPKVDDYGNYLYVVFHTVNLGDEPMDIHTDEVDVFLGANYLITLHDEPRPSIDRLWEAVCEQQKGLSKGPAFLLYELIDRQIDTYTPMIDHFEERLELLGDQIFRSPQRRQEEERLLNDILTAKSSSLRLNRILTPQRELLYKLSHNNYSVVPAEARLYFQDAHDHLVRLSDLANSMRELSSSTIETHFALVNNRINETMKVLTMISTIFIPLSFIAGVYGMNFTFMPEIDQPWAYPLVWLSFLLVGGSMVYFFRRRGWL
ncbi:MAG: magnesium/cobalt transporter CorA [Caldilineaceae bacterium]|nr:magnesium/cobalt transporter CorA [Caldilineaceae bacterium]